MHALCCADGFRSLGGSELFFRALRRECIHEFGQTDAAVQLVFVAAPEETFELYLARVPILSGLLTELGRFIQVPFEVAAELARSQEASFEPVELVEDGAEGHWHALLDLLSDAFHLSLIHI